MNIKGVLLISLLVSMFLGKRVEYHYDKARAARARNFYNGLMLKQNKQYDPEQQTQLITKRVGGKVCQAYDDYALFDFNKLSKMKNPTAAKPYSAIILNKDAKIALIWDVCGMPFVPEKDKLIGDDLTDYVTDDFASCKALGEKDETKGNVYVVKGGKCAYSLKYGKFDADIKPAEDDKKPKQKWELEYSSIQKCDTDESKNFEVDVKGLCTDKTEEKGLETEDIKDCKIKVDYKSPGACYIKYVPIQKYLNSLAPFTGAFMIIFGLVMCFAGSKAVPIMLGILVTIIVTGLCTMVGFNFLTPEKATMVSLIILILVGFIIGGIAGFLAWKMASNYGTFILGFGAGVMLGLLILKLT